MKKDFITKQEQRQPLRHLWGWLKSLQSTLIFMQTGAHPDDETSRLLASLSLGEGMHIVYVNAVRGQGGQNALGPERGDSLGYLRTEELIAAMSLIRADLGWLAEGPQDPIRDFGFSKSGAQTFDHWGETHSLAQMVKMVRLFRPDMIIPTFLDVPGQHGHHRAVTQTTIAAFEAAADASQFPELGLPAWQMNALYLPAWGGGGGAYDDEVPPPNATHEISCGAYDPVYGGTYAQIGEWSRACHATQGMGRKLDEEDQPVPLHQLKTASGKPFTGALSENLPVRLADLADFCSGEAGKKAAHAADAAAVAALAGFPNNAAMLPALCDLQQALQIVADEVAPAHQHRVALKMTQAAMAASEAAAMQLRLEIDPPLPVAGSQAEARLSWHQLAAGGPDKVTARLCGAEQVKKGDFVQQESGPRRQMMTAELGLPGPAVLESMTGWHGVMAASERLHAEVCFEIGKTRFVRPLDPQEIFASRPALTGQMSPARALLLAEKGAELEIQLQLEGEAAHEAAAELILPDGWQAETRPGTAPGSLFARLRPGADQPAGHYQIRAAHNGVELMSGERLSYPHIRRQERFTPAACEVALVASADLAGVRVGWIDGGVDRAHYWAGQLGAEVTLLDDAHLLSGDLAGFDVLVAGVFAGGTRPLNGAMGRIRAWIEQGGHFVSQYHRPIDSWDAAQSAPLPLQPGSPSIRWRVTDASAPVTILQPAHPLLAGPNQIGLEDFDGWVKERGLYFASDWDAAYIPLLAMSDEGEAPLEGSLLAAKIGAGSAVHSALNLFYQMDNLVPGAFRLFANLLHPDAR